MSQCRARLTEENTYGGDTIRYSSPAHGGWGVVRMGMLVPESYQLFVCPFACGRHGAIGAMKQGLKHRLSYLYIDEADIVSGGYEELIVQAVDELLAGLSFRPKVLMIFVSCLDDLLGTDHQAILQVLRQNYRDMRFTFCHMNPITLDSKAPPPVNINRKMFGLLEPREQRDSAENAAALYGPNVKIDNSSELHQVLAAAGIAELRHIADCRSFAEFQKLAGVSLNVVTSPPGLQAAMDSKERLGIDYVYLPVSYDFQEIADSYAALLQCCGRQAEFDLCPARQSAQLAVQAALRELGDMPIIVDASATVRPFTLAKTLCQFGFNVRTVYAQQCIGLEKESYRWLGENAADVEIKKPEHHLAPAVRKKEGNYLAIGFEGAYLTGAQHVVNLVSDETLYGYHGVAKLMELMTAAKREKRDLRLLIKQYGLVV